MFDFDSKARIPRRHRFRRLRVRHDGGEAQGVLHSATSSITTACKASASMPARRPSLSICIRRAGASIAFRRLIETLEWLRKRPEVRARGVEDHDARRAASSGSRRETKLGNPALGEGGRSDAAIRDLKQALAWSKAVNEAVEKIVRGVPPFPFVRESLEKLARQGRFARRLGHAERGPEARMGRARPGAIRRGDLRPGNRHEERIARRRQEVSGRTIR